MSSAVVDGEIKRLSASMINAFDASTPFGCERRFWFRYVAGEQEPTTGNQALGTALHKLIEAELLGLQPDATFEAGTQLLRNGVKMVHAVKAKLLAVEKPIDIMLEGVPLKGFCDAVTEDGIVDWKTTSDLNKYAKKDLSRDTQLLIYAKALHPSLDVVRVAHGYFSTKTKDTRFVESKVSKEQIEEYFVTYLSPLVRRMKDVVKVKNAFEVEGDKSKCRRCPFQNKCAVKENESIMSIFKNLSEKKEPMTSIPNYNSIVPQDAPASAPELAAQPLPSETPPVPKKRGRPTTASKTVETPAVGAEVTFTEVTVSRGATIGLPNYSSAKIDVSATARFTGDREAAYAQVEQFVTAKVESEVARVLEQVKK